MAAGKGSSLNRAGGSKTAAARTTRRVMREELQARTPGFIRHQPAAESPMAALEAMASGLVHELNNALSPVLGYAELALERSPDAAIQEVLERIERGSCRAVGLLRRLELFCRRAPVREPRFLSLAATVEAYLHGRLGPMAAAVQAAVAAGRLHLELDESAYVLGDAEELAVALEELIKNAIEASPEEASITVRAFRQGAEACLQVVDAGVGVDPAMRERCLEPFQTTKTATGAGLGLSVCWGVARRHGGAVVVDSVMPRGASVTLALPVPVAAPA